MSKTLLILGAGPEQIPAIEKAQSLGMHVIAMDRDVNAVGAKFSDDFFCCDIRSSDEVIEILNESGKKIDGVFCHGVEMSVTTALVAEHFNLPSISTSAAICSTNKFERIHRLQEAGIPVAKYRFCKNLESAVAAFQEFELAAFVKPINLAGARGVAYCSTYVELQEGFEIALNLSPQGVLVEEVLTGLQLSTESVVYQGITHTFAIADRNYSRAQRYYPHVIEDGINFPSSISEVEKVLVTELIEDTVKALGIDFGAAKGDLILVNGKPMVIEMASRTSGGWFSVGCITSATGVDPLTPLIQMHVGDSPDLSKLEPTRSLACAQRYLFPNSIGVLTGIVRDEWQDYPTMDNLTLPRIGDWIGPVVDHSKRFGSVICVDQDLSSAIVKCEQLIASINLEISSP
jgi:biotin carboxylase